MLQKKGKRKLFSGKGVNHRKKGVSHVYCCDALQIDNVRCNV